jgi:hypothetical protein
MHESAHGTKLPINYVRFDFRFAGLIGHANKYR